MERSNQFVFLSPPLHGSLLVNTFRSGVHHGLLICHVFFFIPYSSVWGDFFFCRGALCILPVFLCCSSFWEKRYVYLVSSSVQKKNGISTATNLERLILRPRPFGSADPRAAFSFPPKSWCHRGTSASICRSQYFRLHWVFHISHLGLTLSVQFTQTREGHYGWRTCQITE